MKNAPNCFDCKWSKSIPGDAHIQCIHPKIDEPDKILSPLFLLIGRQPPACKRLNVTADSYGIKSGWFAWPLNFDPVWLITCDGFEQHEWLSTCDGFEQHENRLKGGEQNEKIETK